MIIVMKNQSDNDDIARVVDLIRQRGLHEHISRGQECTIIGAVGDERVFDVAEFERLPQVERAIKIVQDWRIISREAWADDTQITVRGHVFGGEKTQFVQSFTQNTLPENAAAVLFDPFYLPDNPYALSGSQNALFNQNIARLHQQNGVAIVRIRDGSQIEFALNAQADIIYLGGELLNNIHVLQQLAMLNTPVVLCKNQHHTVRDWLMAAERVVLGGNQHVILGESGTFNPNSDYLRLDVEAILAAKQLSHLPVLANISRLANRHVSQAKLIELAQLSGADVIVL